MIIWGAKGLAKEILASMSFDNVSYENVLLFDNISQIPDCFLNKKFKIITNINSLNVMEGSDCILGVGGVKNRLKVSNLIKKYNLKEIGYISKNTLISNIDNTIHSTVTILSGCTITASVSIGRSCLINKNVTISHDVSIDDFCEISPNVNILGRVNIGQCCEIGTGAIILPNIQIGDNCIIGAGSVVTKDVSNNSVVIGVPGKVIKKNVQ